jgi:hypothetical protein
LVELINVILSPNWNCAPTTSHYTS